MKIPVLVPERRIQRRVRELGRQISKEGPRRPLTLVVVLGGAYIFAADLARAITRPVSIEFISLSSYGNSRRSSGRVKVRLAPTGPLKGRDVIVVEDIVDTGLTALKIFEILRPLKPRSLKICTLLRKGSNGRVPDYVGFDVPGTFVVGYGLDHAGKHRNLPYIGFLP